MLIFLGVLGLLQITILPGLLIRKNCGLHGGILEQMIQLFPLSLIANYLFIFALAALHLYNRAVLLALIIIELILLAFSYRRFLQSPLRDVFSTFSDGFLAELKPLRDFLTIHTEKGSEILKKWVWVISGCFALSGVIWGLHLCRLNFGTVFSGWDTLFSWNRYAEIWSDGTVPNVRGMYPQLVPANWSVSYVLQGNGAVQFFNTLTPPLFFLMIELMLFDLGFQRRDCGFFIAAVISRFIMKKLLGDGLFDGYMDVPAAAMGLLSFYTLLKAEKRNLSCQRKAIILSAIFAAGAAVTKQSGLITVPVIILAWRILFPEAVRSFSGTQWLGISAAVLVIIAPWYLHCMLYNTQGTERELIAHGIVEFNESYDIRHRLRLAADTLGKYAVCFLVGLIGLCFVPKRYRLIFSLMVWPLTIIWAIFYSYDARNLGLALPFVSMLCGLAVSGFGSFLMRWFARLRMFRIPWIVFGIAAAVVLIFALIHFFPNHKLQEDQRTKQKALFGERLNNELIYDIFGESHNGYDIYTDYPAWFLPGYEECCSSAELTDTFQVRSVLEQDKINWMLLPVIMPNNTDPSKELIEHCIADGKCEQVRCSDGYYKSYCLYQIHR